MIECILEFTAEKTTVSAHLEKIFVVIERIERKYLATDLKKFPRLPSPPPKKSDKFSQSKSCVSLEMPAYSIAGAVERVQAPKLAISQLKCTVLKMFLKSIFASPHLAAKKPAKNIICCRIFPSPHISVKFSAKNIIFWHIYYLTILFI